MKTLREKLDFCFGKKPTGWIQKQVKGDGMSWINHKRKLYVIVSYALELDQQMWLHLSISHQNRIPTYEEMTYLKKHWAGDEAKAIEVHAPRMEHVNIQKHTRHLWECLTSDPLPDFTRGTKSI